MKLQILIFIVLFGCNNNLSIPFEYKEWKIKRKSALYAEDGYLNLAGLYPIENGIYTIGSGDYNDIRFPDDFPDDFGKADIEDSVISFYFNDHVLLNDTLKVKYFKYNYFKHKNNFTLGSFLWYVHMDSGVKGIRVRNFKNPLLDEDLNINFFSYDSHMIIKAKFEKFSEPLVKNLKNIQGGSFNDVIPGIIHFTFNNNDYSLLPTIAPSGRFFIVFGDQTNGNESYGGGRFLYINPPQKNGDIIIDFNKAYNPPCVFSTFTTCPIPSKENILPFKVNAGEKNYNGILFSSVYQ
tara:strand:- start:267 stop:1148 length:882 start_codon:yes stop_codon:yes gene_type:complete